MALRDTILAAQDLPRESVDVPEWGCRVWLRPLMLGERDRYLHYYQRATAQEQPVHLSAMLVSLAVVDEQGANVFTEGDLGLIGQKCAPVVDRLAARIQELSGLRSTAKADAEKNSASIPSEPSSIA